MQVYMLVDCVDGKFITTRLNASNVIPALEVRGYAYNGENRNAYHRPELQGQPRFRGLSGPMWGGRANGEIVIRYETPEACRVLST